VARQSQNRPKAEEPEADETAAELAVEQPDAELEVLDVEETEVEEATAGPETESEEDEPAKPEPGTQGRELWDEARITPVEIALPGGVGLTLRAYRMSSSFTPTELEVDEEDPFDARQRLADARLAKEEEVVVDEEFAALLAEGDADPKDATTSKDADDETAEEPDPADFTDEEAEAEAEVEDEEVPMFLTHRGRLLAFKSPESLVSFIRSGAPHDLAQLDTWSTVAERVESSDVDPLPDDRYELDLVVENLRGGHDTWDLPLLIAAGEVARDLGFALRLKPVILALSPGSPLDDLDESLRAAESGGMGGFFGRRRLRKIGAQQASLGWRSIIGKISAAVDWRD
jgi:hypothetical protein